MAAVGIGLLGCGVVGSAVVRGLADLPVAGHIGLRRVCVRDVARRRDCKLDADLLTDDPWEVVDDPRVNVVVEAIGGVERAASLIARAVDLGKPVVTANKAVLGAVGPALRRRAAGCGVPLLFEAAVAGAVPVIRGLAGLLRVDEIVKVEGLLNGTTTFVLAHIQATGATLEEALAEARQLGYAEADASRDLDGSDAADKLAVIAQYLFDEDLHSHDVNRVGLDALGREDLTATDRCWRLLATAVPGRCARVEPVALRPDHPYAQLSGPAAAVTITGARSGATTLLGQGAGGEATACSILADVLAAGDWLATRLRQPAAGHGNPPSGAGGHVLRPAAQPGR